jgi:hypothetical protein
LSSLIPVFPFPREELVMPGPSTADTDTTIIFLFAIREIILRSPTQSKLTRKLLPGTEVTLVPLTSASGSRWLVTALQKPMVGLPEEHFHRLCDAGAVDIEIGEIKGDYFPS